MRKWMAVADSVSVQTLLYWMLGMEIAPEKYITEGQAREAAARLAGRSCQGLGAGLDADELQRRWGDVAATMGMTAIAVIAEDVTPYAAAARVSRN